MPRPIVKATRIPNVIHIYETAPAGPFISVGAVSEIYFGQNTENAPTDTPYIILPKHNTQNSLISVNSTPVISRTFERIMQFHLPKKEIYPENNAPMAPPAVVNDYTMTTLLSYSSSFHPLRLPYAPYAVFQDPIIYPNYIVPSEITPSRHER